jgi:hypothetical protein
VRTPERKTPEFIGGKDERENRAGVVGVLLLGQQRSHPRGHRGSAVAPASSPGENFLHGLPLRQLDDQEQTMAGHSGVA